MVWDPPPLARLGARSSAGVQQGRILSSVGYSLITQVGDDQILWYQGSSQLSRSVPLKGQSFPPPPSGGI